MAGGTYVGGCTAGGGGKHARVRAELAAQRRAERWVARRQQQRRAETAAVTARLARERLEGRT